jgi:hypothetical protein
MDESKAQAAKSELLVERLRRHIARLEGIMALHNNAELQGAIQDLKDEVEDVRMVASHVYGPPPRRR